jgi:hypothetical protein
VKDKASAGEVNCGFGAKTARGKTLKIQHSKFIQASISNVQGPGVGLGCGQEVLWVVGERGKAAEGLPHSPKPGGTFRDPLPREASWSAAVLLPLLNHLERPTTQKFNLASFNMHRPRLRLGGLVGD